MALQCFTTHCSLPVLLCDDFYLLLLANDQMKGCHFNNTEEVHVVSKTILQKVVHDGSHNCFKQLHEHWHRYAAAAAERQYFEGNCTERVLSAATFYNDSCPKLFEDFTYIVTRVKRCTPIKYTYFPNSFYPISLVLMFIYCRYKSIFVKLITP
jgi:hypothetical protein